MTSQQDVVNNIQSLQNVEKHLYSSLAEQPPGSNIDMQKQVIDKINNISQTRISLFKHLDNVYSQLKNDVSNESKALKNQMKTIKSVESQLNKSKEQINNAKDANINNLRLTEINTYYGQEYSAYMQVFKYISFMCIGLICLAMFRQRYITGPRTTNILAMILIVISLIFIIPALFDIGSRNNMVFDEYDFYFDPTHPEQGDQDSSTIFHDLKNKLEAELFNKKYDRDLELIADGACVGPGCCKAKGLLYDKKKEVCVSHKKSKDSEGFLSGQSTQDPGAFLNNPDTISKSLVEPPSSDLYSLN